VGRQDYHTQYLCPPPSSNVPLAYKYEETKGEQNGGGPEEIIIIY
jgi:hypothetical protein